MSVSVRFVGSAATAGADALAASDLCEQYRSNGIASTWITESDCSKLSQITKRDVFVLENFDTPVFNKLIKTKAVVIGPRCLSCCLTEGSEIPPGPHPVFTVAMRKVVATISYVEVDKKQLLGQKIMWMGGKYENVLTEETTHLISGTVLSEKYMKATSLGIKIMKPDWIEAVWKSSLKENMCATNSHFDEYKLPIFYNLVLCMTGLEKDEKKKITNIIIENGGKMLRNLETEVVNILIVNNGLHESEKFKAARQYDILCVTPSWVYKSLQKGYSVDTKDYTIHNNKTSSPNRQSQLPDFTLDFSVITNVRNKSESLSTICTDNTDYLTPMQKGLSKNQKGRNTKFCGIVKELAQLVDAIEMKEVKQAGLFLDGCGIYIYGLTATRRDKLHKVISRAGAVRYDQPTESVTHAICGDPSMTSSEQHMSRAIHVTVRWLVDSLHARKTLDESPYLVFPNENIDENNKKGVVTMPSPMSKRNLQLLRTPNLPPVPLFSLNMEKSPNKEKDDIIQQYIQQKKSDKESNEPSQLIGLHETTLEENDCQINPHADSTVKLHKLTNNTAMELPHTDSNVKDTLKSDERENCVSPINLEEQIFEGITFELRDIEDECEQITQRILHAGGIMVPAGKGGTYIIVPLNCDDMPTENEGTKIVTSMWLDDCLLQEKIVPIEYYHKPIKINLNTKPLDGLVFAISTYNGTEREFVMEVAVLLGGIVQASLHRRQAASAHRSTHLICPEATGAKYNGAINWGLPVVTSQWLLDCAVANKYIPETRYLVGCSKELNQSKKTADETSIVKANDESIASNNKIIETKSHDSFTSRPSSDMKNQDKFDELENKDVSQIINNAASEDTPLKQTGKFSLGAEISPASRYIAMAREGLFGFESQDTPKRKSEAPFKQTQNKDSLSTPPMDNALATPNLALYSPTSRRRLVAIKRGERPSNPPRTPKNPFEMSISTPESPFGATLQMSPNSRKRLWKFCENLPHPTEKQNEKHITPISELKKQFFESCSNKNDASVKPLVLDVETPPPKIRKLAKTNESLDFGLQNQIKQLSSFITGSESNDGTPRSLRNKRGSTIASPLQSTAFKIDQHLENVNDDGPVESQLDTIGWDDMSEPTSKVYKFMLSLNVDNVDEIKRIIERLGGTIVESKEVDLSATHLLCSRLGRSEKFLGFLASGKWILHPTYIVRSQEAGRFVDEELYEWGNPKAQNLKGNDNNEKKFAAAVYRWRLKRFKNVPLPFESFNVIMYIQRESKGPLLRVLKAGGGKILDISPPFKGDLNATVCFMEKRKMKLPDADMAYLASRRIPVCPPILLNSILIEDPPPSAIDIAYPEYKQLL